MLTAQIATSEQAKKTGLEYKFYAPKEEGPRPIVLMVHGRTGNFSVMWPFTRAFQHLDPLVLAPQAPTSDPDGGFSWWPVRQGDVERRTPEERLKECVEAVSLLRNFLQEAALLHHGDLSQVYAMGFSQGAGLVSSLSIIHPDSFRGVALLAGFIPEIITSVFSEVPPQGACAMKHTRRRPPESISNTTDFQDIPPRPDRLSLSPSHCEGESEGGRSTTISDPCPKLPYNRGERPTSYFIAHGSEDRILPVERSYQARDFLLGRGAEVELITEKVGHKLGAEGGRALASWFDRIFREGRGD